MRINCQLNEGFLSWRTKKMNWKLIITLLMLSVIWLVVNGCTTPPPAVEADAYDEYVKRQPEGSLPVPREVFEQAIQEGQLNTYEWAEWWPEEIYEDFTKEFGIKIVRDYFASEDETIAKFKLDPGAGYDWVYTGLRPAVTLRELGALREINDDWVPNVVAYMPEWALKEGATYGDPGWKYAKPTHVSVLAYTYNAKFVDDPRVPSWAVLFEPDEKYRGKITLVDDMKEVITSALVYKGYKIDTTDEAELREIRDLLMGLKPYIMAYDWWPVRLLIEEESQISHTWAGDALWFHRELDSIQGVLPAEGSQVAFGTNGIAKGSSHPAAAHLWLNYIWRPDVMAKIMETIAYSPVHTEVANLLSQEVREWHGTVLTEEYLAKSQWDRPELWESPITDLWTQIWLELKE
jgi:spermidine/putrescine transport system substrate-binding protein